MKKVGYILIAVYVGGVALNFFTDISAQSVGMRLKRASLWPVNKFIGQT